jgi:hypothetical protein
MLQPPPLLLAALGLLEPPLPGVPADVGTTLAL